MNKLAEISAELAQASNAREQLGSSLRFALVLVGVSAVLATLLLTLV